jgi:hypothetical protein
MKKVRDIRQRSYISQVNVLMDEIKITGQNMGVCET